jgi:hypothetical protein
MQVHLFSTTNVKADREMELQRMLDSVSALAASSLQPAVTLDILFQHCSPDRLAELKAALPAFVRAQAVEGQVSLSKARNILLAPALAAQEIAPEALVAFPDDDGWYPAGLVERVIEHLEADPQLGFFFCRYGSQPRQWSPDQPLTARPASSADVVRNASSNTIFVRGSVATAVGLFDEQLGLGTPNHGAEDLDYALRAYLTGQGTAYADAILVGHRDKTPGIRAKYYRGGMIALGRYGRRQAGLARELARKTAVGAYLCLRRELSVGDYLSAVRAGLFAA